MDSENKDKIQPSNQDIYASHLGEFAQIAAQSARMAGCKVPRGTVKLAYAATDWATRIEKQMEAEINDRSR